MLCFKVVLQSASSCLDVKTVHSTALFVSRGLGCVAVSKSLLLYTHSVQGTEAEQHQQ